MAVCPVAANVIFAGCLDGTLNVVDARAGKILKTFTGHTKEILDIAVCKRTNHDALVERQSAFKSWVLYSYHIVGFGTHGPYSFRR